MSRAACLPLFVVIAAAGAGCGSRAPGPVEQTGVWQQATPVSQHVDPKRLAAADRWAQTRVLSLSSLIVARHGRLVFERYYHLGASNQAVPIFSITKSIISTLVGIALGERKLKSLGLKVGEVLGADIPQRADPRVRSITLRELLTMTSGFGSAATDPFGDGGGDYRTTPNWVRSILGSKLAREPGTTFYYDNGDAQLVSAVLQRVTGETAANFASTRLFRPLGIDAGSWWADRQGVTDGAAGLLLHPRDLAKIGELYLRDGSWRGRQLVPASYIRAATTTHALPATTRAGLGYGYLWWTYHGAQFPPLFLAIGSGGQFVIVAPTLDTVVVLTSDSDASRPETAELDLARRVLSAVKRD